MRSTLGLILVKRSCPLWVKSRHLQCKKACPLYPRKRTFGSRETDALRRMIQRA